MKLFFRSPKTLNPWYLVGTVVLLAAAAQIDTVASPSIHAVKQKLSRVSTKSLTGFYVRKDRSDLHILELPGHKLKFAAFALGPYSASDPAPAPSTGELSGIVTLRGNRAVYSTSYGQGVCRVAFQFSSSKAILSQNGSGCDFGAGVDVTGVYQKKDSRVPKPEVFELHN